MTEVVVSAGDGTLLGRITRLSIEDARPSLSFRLRIPVIVEDKKGTLRVELRYPDVRSWQGLSGRTYRFDESTRTYEKSDGETYARDDVFGDLRTATSYFDTYVTAIAFGDVRGEHVTVTVEGTVRMNEELVPFAVDARLHVNGVVVEEGDADDAARLLDEAAYQPGIVRDGAITYDPKFH